MRRFYLFVLMQTVCENAWQFFQFIGMDKDFVAEKIDPFFYGLNSCLLGLYFSYEVLSPSGVHLFEGRKKTWAYFVGCTYIIFQLFDAVQYAKNWNIDNPKWEFVSFAALNIIYFIVYKLKSKVPVH